MGVFACFSVDCSFFLEVDPARKDFTKAVDDCSKGFLTSCFRTRLALCLLVFPWTQQPI